MAETDGAMENVFIAWSGNYELACEVAKLLEQRGDNVVVGGGYPRGMFIGSQVINQMDSCTHAIILAQKKSDTDSSSKFSDNLMFEWGYLVSKLPEGRVSTYLIDTQLNDLPSDLGGTWAESVVSAGRPSSEAAEDIVRLFNVERPRLDKIEVIAGWQDVKGLLDEYIARHSRSHSEVAQYVLFSVLSSFYNNEVDVLDRKIASIKTRSESLSAVISMVRAMLRVYISTSYMAKPLGISEYTEVITQLEHRFEKDIDPADEDLAQWVHIVRLEHMQFSNYLMALSIPDDDDTYYHEEVIRLGKSAVKLVNENLSLFPENKHFAAIYLSYLHRNMAISYRVLGMEKEAVEQLDESVRMRAEFFFHYRDRHPEDVMVCDKIAQEYYLALLEQTEFESDAHKRRNNMRTVRAYISGWEEQSRLRQSLFNMVRDAYAHVEKAQLAAGGQDGDK